MNKRIDELFAQALDQAVPETWTTLNPVQLSRLKDKLAELIVQECIDVGLEQKKWVEDQQVFNESDEIWNRARIQQTQHIVDKIKEHFGVPS